MPKLVSVIIPVYNAAPYLPSCVDSLLAQHYQPVELLFVDDGSTDASPALLDGYAARHDCVTVIHQANAGVSGARNAALEIARGTYVAFCDSDDVVHADWLATLVSALETSGAQMACCGYDLFDNGHAPQYTLSGQAPDERTGCAAMYRGVLLEDNVRGYLFNKLYLRDVIRREPRLRFRTDLHILEDQVFVMEYMKRISSCVCLDSRLYGYRNTPGSAVKQPLSDRQLTSLLGRRLICRLAGETDDPLLIRTAAGQLAKALAYCFKDAVLSASPSKRRWIRQILQTCREERACLRGRYPLCFRERVLLLLLKATALFVR
ncbi:MAG: glycosyltransferase family 2 protein [Aristaeellaceae bacterium]